MPSVDVQWQKNELQHIFFSAFFNSSNVNILFNSQLSVGLPYSSYLWLLWLEAPLPQLWWGPGWSTTGRTGSRGHGALTCYTSCSSKYQNKKIFFYLINLSAHSECLYLSPSLLNNLSLCLCLFQKKREFSTRQTDWQIKRSIEWQRISSVFFSIL